MIVCENNHTTAATVEIGWIIAGALDDVDIRAVQIARERVSDYLNELLPEFTWKLPVVRRDELVADILVEPAVLLNDALAERNYQHWDAALVVTAADLVSRYKLDSNGVLSRSLEAIVVSTRRIDPRREDLAVDEECRVRAISRRVKAIVLYALGRMYGLAQTDDCNNWMYSVESVNDLDEKAHWSEDQIKQLRQALHQVADQRLEESKTTSRRWPLFFYIAGTWINFGNIVHAVRKAEPWKFPFRLSRLTATSMSGLFILLLTAEVWELGMAQNGTLIAGLSLLIIASTTWYIVGRQGLLLRRQRHPLTEQNVATNLSTVVIVLTGIATTYCLLFMLAFSAGMLLFDNSLLKGWNDTLASEVRVTHYLTVAGFVAMLGILVGALGASFEGNHYFRHVTFVDEEL